MERHKAVQFPSPFFPEELELDPEKALWVPGKKKIFVPALKRAEFGIDWGFITRDMTYLLTQEMYEKSVMKLVDEARFEVVNRREQEELEYAYERVCECVPGRSRFISSPRDVPVVTYNDIRRSEVPQFRGGRRDKLVNYW